MHLIPIFISSWERQKYMRALGTWIIWMDFQRSLGSSFKLKLACKEVKIRNKTKVIIDMVFVSFMWYETALTKSSCKKKNLLAEILKKQNQLLNLHISYLIHISEQIKQIVYQYINISNLNNYFQNFPKNTFFSKKDLTCRKEWLLEVVWKP